MNEGASTESWVLFAERVKGQVAELHNLLLAALTELSPRCEGPVFHALRRLLSCSGTREHVLRWHLQDVVASLVFLSPQEWTDCEVSVVSDEQVEALWGAEPTATSSESKDLARLPYVSARERLCCLSFFVSLVVQPKLATRFLFEAVYPLLLESEHAAEVPDTARSNTLAPALFRRLPTMRAKRSLIVGALDTLVMRRRDGIASMADALLADGVAGRGSALSAPHRCAELVLRSAPPLVFSAVGARIVFQRLSAEDEVRSIAEQLLSLLSGELLRISGRQGPQTQARSFDTDASRSDRIWEMIYVMLSRMLSAKETNDAGGVPAVDTSSLGYRRFYYVNKHLLTPAFAPLTGRTRCAPERVVFALRCLRSIAYAASLTSWFDGCLNFLWERVKGGFLDLMMMLPDAVSVVEVGSDGFCTGTCEAEQWSLSHDIWRQLVSMPNRVEPLMYALARAVFTSASVSKAVRAQHIVRCGVSFVEREESSCPAVRVVMTNVLKWFGRVIGAGGGSIVKRALRRFFHYSCVVAQQSIVGSSTGRGSETCVSHAEAIAAITDAFLFPDTASLLLCGEDVGSLASTCACLATLSPQLAVHAARIVQMAAETTNWRECRATEFDEFSRAATSMVSFLRSEERVLPTLLQSGGVGGDQETTASERNPRTFDSLASLDAALEKVMAARAQLQEPDAQRWAAVRRAVEASVSELLTRWSSRSAAATAIAMMKLSAAVVSAAALPAAEVASLGPSLTQMEPVLVQCLSTSEDATLLGHAVVVYARAVLLGLITEKQLLERLYEAASCHNDPIRRCDAAAVAKRRKGPDVSVLVGRLFDVLLAICDDDHNGVRCRTIDDECKRQRSSSLPEYVAATCRRLAACGDGATYAAGLHMIGMYCSRIVDRVSMSWLCQFGTDAMRLGATPEMKLAGAAMLSTLALALRQSVDPSNLSRLGGSVDLALLLELGNHMSRYIAQPALLSSQADTVRTSILSDRFDEVIRLHGRIVVEQIQAMSRECLRSGDAAEPSNAWGRSQWNLWRKGSTEESALLDVVRQVIIQP